MPEGLIKSNAGIPLRDAGVFIAFRVSLQVTPFGLLSFYAFE